MFVVIHAGECVNENECNRLQLFRNAGAAQMRRHAPAWLFVPKMRRHTQKRNLPDGFTTCDTRKMMLHEVIRTAQSFITFYQFTSTCSPCSETTPLAHIIDILSMVRHLTVSSSFIFTQGRIDLVSQIIDQFNNIFYTLNNCSRSISFFTRQLIFGLFGADFHLRFFFVFP